MIAWRCGSRSDKAGSLLLAGCGLRDPACKGVAGGSTAGAVSGAEPLGPAQNGLRPAPPGGLRTHYEKVPVPVACSAAAELEVSVSWKSRQVFWPIVIVPFNVQPVLVVTVHTWLAELELMIRSL